MPAPTLPERASDPPANLAATASSPPTLSSLISDRATIRAIRSLCLDLRRRRPPLDKSEAVATATLKALRAVVARARFTSVHQLDLILRTAGNELQSAALGEQVISNVTLRVIHLLHEEAIALELEHPDALCAPPQPPATARQQQQQHHRHDNQPITHPASPSPAAVSSSPPPTASAASPSSSSSRPGLSAFRAGSAYSISDLVSASAAAGSAGVGGGGGSSSGAATPASAVHGSLSMSQLGQGVEALSIASPTGRERADVDDDEGGDDEDDDDDALEGGEEDEQGEDEHDEDGAALGARPSPRREPKTAPGDKAGGGATAGASASASAPSTLARRIKPLLVQAMRELLEELETADASLARDARDHVHPGEVVLTLGHSSSVEAFLVGAAAATASASASASASTSASRHFTVVVAEAAPAYSGHEMARRLCRARVHCLVVSDACVASLMPRVAKVVLGADAVLANGGALVGAGGAAVAVAAARERAVPVVVLAPLYRLSPGYDVVGRATATASSCAPSSAAAAATTATVGRVDEWRPTPLATSSSASAVELGASANVGRTNAVFALDEHAGAAVGAAASRFAPSSARDATSRRTLHKGPPRVGEAQGTGAGRGGLGRRGDESGDDEEEGPPPPSSVAQSGYADFVSSVHDYVAPEHVDALLTNAGEHAPSLVYRLVREQYGLAMPVDGAGGGVGGCAGGVGEALGSGAGAGAVAGAAVGDARGISAKG